MAGDRKNKSVLGERVRQAVQIGCALLFFATLILEVWFDMLAKEMEFNGYITLLIAALFAHRLPDSAIADLIARWSNRK